MRGLSGFCLMTFASCVANAHHATVANFTQEIISVDGIVEQVRYQNPHTSLLISQTSDNGKKSYWLLEAVGSTTLEQRGVSRDRMVVGEKIHATGRNGLRQNTMYLHEVEDAKSIFSVWRDRHPTNRSGQNSC